LEWKAIYFLSEVVKNELMLKHPFSLVAMLLTASVLWTALAHVCSDLSSMQKILQAPCEHMPTRDEPLDKKTNDNCDSIRYGMLSTQASPSPTDFFKLRAIHVLDVLTVAILLPDVLRVFSRSRPPPFQGFSVSSSFSHVVLRI
jgi:hypothetical protein